MELSRILNPSMMPMAPADGYYERYLLFSYGEVMQSHSKQQVLIYNQPSTIFSKQEKL